MSYSYRVSEVFRYLNQIKKMQQCLSPHAFKKYTPKPNNTHRRHPGFISNCHIKLDCLKLKNYFAILL